MTSHRARRWPKVVPPLTDEQLRIKDDFFSVWLEELPRRYQLVENFNHSYPRRTLGTELVRTLDIGAGRGGHIPHEDLSRQEYVALDVRDNLAEHIKAEYPSVQVVVGDIHGPVPLPDGYFDRILAIHVFEHLPDLPRALDEVRRMLATNGKLSVLIPCDPGFAYGLARRISAQRLFERRYGQSYGWFIRSEHINSPSEIIRELEQRFEVQHREFFPLRIPVVSLNLVIGLTLTPKPA